MSVCKKVFDLSCSAVGLLFLSPLMLLIALFVYLDSPGPVIFSQKRLGKNSQLFLMHKFRKFPADWGSKGPGVTTSGDIRMTRVGAVLERTKLDELPQLWNILKGEMSFVGPRPESVRYQNLFQGEYKKVLEFVPGIFGPNQVAYRNESSMYPNNIDPEIFYKEELFPNKAKADIAYFSDSSCISDLVWIIKGIRGTIGGIVNWKKFTKRHSLVLLIDLIFIELAWVFAHWFRFGFSISENNFLVFLTGCWLLPLIILPIMLIGGCYRHPVRYFSVSDVMRLILVVPLAWMIAILVELGFFYRNMSIGIAFFGLILLLVFLLSPRVWRRERWIMTHKTNATNTRNILICGAHVKGSALARFLDQAYPEIKIVGFIDEDEELRGRHLNGYKVWGSWRDRNVILEKVDVTELWVSDSIPQFDDSSIQKWGEQKNVKTVFLNHIREFSKLGPVI